MSVSANRIPSAFRAGYEKARLIDPERAATYVKYTTVADPIADAAVASLADFSKRDVHRLIEAGVSHNSEVLKTAPRELQDFFEYLKSPPDDVRFQSALALEGSRAFYATSDMFVVAIVARGLVDNVSTLMGRSFLSTGYTTFEGVQRLRTSLKQVLESMLPGGLEWYGDGWKLSVRARLYHAQARRIISMQPQSWDVEEFGAPVSTAHIGFATASFSSGVLSVLPKLGVKVSREARDGYVHNWRYIGWLLGLPEDILIKDEADGVEWIKIGRMCEPEPDVDSIIMAHSIITSTAIGIVGLEDRDLFEKQATEIYRITRAIIGNELADQLDFPKSVTFGVLAALRWKRRIEKLIGRAPSKADNFMMLLEGTEAALGHYELRQPEQG